MLAGLAASWAPFAAFTALRRLHLSGINISAEALASDKRSSGLCLQTFAKAIFLQEVHGN